MLDDGILYAKHCCDSCLACLKGMAIFSLCISFNWIIETTGIVKLSPIIDPYSRFLANKTLS